MDRRRVLLGSLALAATAAAPRAPARAALPATPAQTAGPFYPRQTPPEQDADLLRIGPDGARADGEPAAVFGRVLDPRGRPLPGLRVEIWQCDARGYYHHVRAYSGGDPKFQGFGRTRTGADGGYRFRTIKPVPYGARTPHIHVRIAGRGVDGLTTQLYIRGHPMNADDFVLARVPPAARERVMADFAPAAPDGPALARFDIVLGTGLLDG